MSCGPAPRPQCRRPESRTRGFESGPGSIDVLADQPHMRQPVVGKGRGTALIAAGNAEILDHLEDPIAVVVEADDGRLHGDRTPAGPCRRESHSPGHHVGWRQHPHAQNVAIKRHRRFAVRHTHARVGQSRNHRSDDVKNVDAALEGSTNSPLSCGDAWPDVLALNNCISIRYQERPLTKVRSAIGKPFSKHLLRASWGEL